MARIKLAYIGGGSTRAPGTVASFIEQGENFQGSEIVLIDLDKERLEVVKTIAEKMARNRGIDLTVKITTNRRAGITDCDAVLTSYRPGGFEARYLDESISIKHGVIGQETQGPGGFFMALRSIHIMKDIVEDIEFLAPNARIFNYTNPINIISEAVTHHSDVPIYSFCEGPFDFASATAVAADLDPDKLETVMVGLNHGCWSVRHLYEGQDVIPMLQAAYERKLKDDSINTTRLRLLKLAVEMNSIPADYFQYYYYRDEIVAEMQAKPTTRAQDILVHVPDYWRHYREQAASDNPQLDPQRSRGGIHELELAIDAMDAIFNDRGDVLPVNYPNHGALSDFPDDLVVEMRGLLDKNGVTRLVDGPLPKHVVGLVKMLGEYQALAAEAAWCGRRIDAIRALAANPLVMSVNKAEAIYDDLAVALRDYLPERLLS
ncbi:MAG: glycoside hydrolase [Anaerolineae bacterium]|nr:glycoside hydrolase [Anaerolineae bacterium]